ncbi:MAG TPA: hypothetical protein VN631_15535 [Negativicutes bacterium]|nr:hypothetical protein [Negativicutes bacterium]
MDETQKAVFLAVNTWGEVRAKDRTKMLTSFASNQNGHQKVTVYFDYTLWK